MTASDGPLSRDGRTAPTGPGRAARFFLWCGAVDTSLLTSRTETYRFVNVGAFVVLVAVLAGASLTLISSTRAGGFTPWILPVALLWASVVFVLDRSIVAEPGYGDLRLDSVHRRAGDDATGAFADPSPPPAGRLARAGTYLLRVGLAVGVAWLIGEALLLSLFADEVERELNARHQAEFAQETARITAANDRLIEEGNRELTANASARTAATDQAETARGQVELERTGGRGSSGLVGPGANTQAEVDQARAAESVAAQTLESTTIRDAEIRADIADRQAENLAIESGDIDRFPSLVGARDAIFGNRGFAEQEAALGDYLDRHSDQPTVVAVPWIVRGVLLVVDLMPILLKIATPYTVYGQRLRDRGTRQRQHDAVEAVLAARRLDRRASIEAFRIDLESEVELAIEQNRARRLLGRPLRSTPTGRPEPTQAKESS